MTIAKLQALSKKELTPIVQSLEKDSGLYSRVKKNGVDKTPEVDTVDFSHNQNKKNDGLGKKIIAGVSAALLALGGVGAFVLSKGKFKKGVAQGLEKAGAELPKLAEDAKPVTQQAEKLLTDTVGKTVKKLNLEVKIPQGALNPRNSYLAGSEYFTKQGLTAAENKKLVEILEECKDLTFNSPALNLMKEKYGKISLEEIGKKYGIDVSKATAPNPDINELFNVLNQIKAKTGKDAAELTTSAYDLGLKYAVVANNTAKLTGSGAIINEVPEIFKGVAPKTLVEKLDKLSTLLTGEKKLISTFEIGGKEYSAECIGEGLVSRVYKISDKAGNQICFKQAKDPFYWSQGQGIFAETAVAQEAYKAGVVDVPKFYMGNPVGKFVDANRVKGAWQLNEFIQPNKVVKDGLKFEQWLDSKGLAHLDKNAGTKVGDYFVDFGGIVEKNMPHNELCDVSAIYRGYVKGETTADMLKTLKNLQAT